MAIFGFSNGSLTQIEEIFSLTRWMSWDFKIIFFFAWPPKATATTNTHEICYAECTIYFGHVAKEKHEEKQEMWQRE